MKIKKKKKTDGPSGSLKVNPTILSQAKEHCKKEGILIGHFGTVALIEKLEKEKAK